MQTLFKVGQKVVYAFHDVKWARVDGTIKRIGKKRLQVEIYWTSGQIEALWISPRRLRPAASESEGHDDAR